ncbi:hypothetical protein K1T71_005416 [Dendrolimus kikuchii]|uniref:Uncharacterized protein n=1 Tax=Dendrolimus kikuchii TaxID=765133 RepID=A0ACC1D491_9NEOP|nr:hypothetical protein K1T71_005416 [Dendrolimus kikuchii]
MCLLQDFIRSLQYQRNPLERAPNDKYKDEKMDPRAIQTLRGFITAIILEDSRPDRRDKLK